MPDGIRQLFNDKKHTAMVNAMKFFLKSIGKIKNKIVIPSVLHGMTFIIYLYKNLLTPA